MPPNVASHHAGRTTTKRTPPFGTDASASRRFMSPPRPTRCIDRGATIRRRRGPLGPDGPSPVRWAAVARTREIHEGARCAACGPSPSRCPTPTTRLLRNLARTLHAPRPRVPPTPGSCSPTGSWRWAAPGRRLRLRFQAGLHELGRRSLDNPMRLRLPAAGARPRGRGRRRRAGARGGGSRVGDRVVLNPWLSCGPRGVEPHVPGVRRRRLLHLLELPRRADRARHPHRHLGGVPVDAPTSSRRTTRCSSGTRRRSPTSVAVLPTRSRCRCTR